MDDFEAVFAPSRTAVLLKHLSEVPDPRDPRRVAHPLPEVLLLVVCGTICDCDDYDAIADWGKAHLATLRRLLPYHFGVPCGRWLTILMNRLPRALFAQAFTDFVREAFPGAVDHIAIDGKTSRRSHDRASGQAALHLVSAFATTERLVLGQEAVRAKANELSAIPALINKLSEKNGLKGALLSIDAMATNATIAQTILDAGADYLLAVKANQSTIRAEIERYFSDVTVDRLDTHADIDKGHGRIEERRVDVATEVDWLDGGRRFPGETRLPGVRAIIRVASRTQLRDQSRFETRYFIASRRLDAKQAAKAVRAHWAIENTLHWTLDVVFHEDQSRLRKGEGAANMAVVRHFAFNLVRQAPGNAPLKRMRKRAGWKPEVLLQILNPSAR
ncbi:MAG: ISAs1 family transposase [Beijerinckiaceae bacterium]